MEKLRGVTKLSKDVESALDGDVRELGRALRAHYQFRRNGFMECVTRFCEKAWESIDSERTTAIKQVEETGSAIKTTLKRLQSIGKHVKLVSLNASVEASRIGDAL